MCVEVMFVQYNVIHTGETETNALDLQSSKKKPEVWLALSG